MNLGALPFVPATDSSPNNENQIFDAASSLPQEGDLDDDDHNFDDAAIGHVLEDPADEE